MLTRYLNRPLLALEKHKQFNTEKHDYHTDGIQKDKTDEVTDFKGISATSLFCEAKGQTQDQWGTISLFIKSNSTTSSDVMESQKDRKDNAEVSTNLTYLYNDISFLTVVFFFARVSNNVCFNGPQ